MNELTTGFSNPVSLEGVSPGERGGILHLGTPSTNPGFCDIVDFAPGSGNPAKLSFVNTHRIITWAFDRAGRPVAGLRWTANGGKEILDLRDTAAPVVVSAPPEDDLRLITADQEGGHILVLTNRDSNLTCLVRISLTTGETEILSTDPHARVDVSQIVMGWQTGDVAAVSYMDESVRWVVRSSTFKALLSATRKTCDPGNLISAHCSQDMRRWLLEYSSSVEPGEVWLYEAGSQHMRMLWRDRPELDRRLLSKTRSITFQARDGTKMALLNF